MRSPYQPFDLTAPLALGPGVRVLLVVTVAVALLQLAADRMTGGLFTLLFALRPWAVLHGQLWQLVTYLFLHGSLLHLLLNMLGLFFFGRETESALGLRRFLALYFGCGVAAGVGWMLLSGLAHEHCLGASGAVFGVMGAFAAMFPGRRVTLLVFFVLPVTMTARMMILLLGGSTVLALFFSDGNIAHSAHLAGGLAGYFWGRRLARAADRAPRPAERRGLFRSGRGGASAGEAEEMPTREDIDVILEKISRDGMRSLSRRDRQLLERASRRASR